MLNLKLKREIYSRRAALLPMLLFALQACSREPIGQELSQSFDSPVEISRSEDISTENDSKTQTLIKTDPPVKTKERTGLTIGVDKKTNNNDNYLAPFTPRPYRITIKLSAANPSAPAETVTKALRKAGVSFEVEKIERVKEKQLTKVSRERGIGL